MFLLALKMFLRKRGTPSAVLAIALLIAILASMNSIINHLNWQTNILSRYVGIGQRYLILSINCTSLETSKVDKELASTIKTLMDTQYILTQKLFTANITTKSGSHKITVRAVDNVQEFLTVRNAIVKGVSGTFDDTQVYLGEILARTASINSGDHITLFVNNRSIIIEVAGIITTLTQSDAELIIPLKIITKSLLTEEESFFIEFAPKNPRTEDEIVNCLTQNLPPNTKVVKVQQLKEFLQGINAQTLSFLNLWSLTVYAIVSIASYIITVRLLTEANYDLAVIRALGAKGRLLFKLALTYTLIATLSGAIIGLATGVAIAQMASTAVRWILIDVNVTPFLEAWQALQILLLSLASSILGCIYPALKFAYTHSNEPSL
jgi:ABC-type lipoprotein release transport system permease subunit